MIKVGLIANEKVFKHIEKELVDEKIELFNLKNLDKEKIEDIDIVVHNNISRNKIDEGKIKEVTKKSKYLLINSDEGIGSKLFDENNLNIITYGLNNKATITVSSVEEESILIDIQREIKDINEKVIEVGESKVGHMKNRNVQEILVMESLRKLCDLK